MRDAIRVVERQDEVPGADFFEFKVYVSPENGSTVLGFLRPSRFLADLRQANVGGGFGVPVKTAYLDAFSLCRAYGVQVLWINDPDQRFPPENRPSSNADALFLT